MNIGVLTYLPMRLLLTLRDFLYHWYIGSFRATSHFMLNLYESLDKTFALRINLRSLFKPMYQDRSPVGYIIGFFFRGFKVVMASFIYLALFLVSVLLYFVWIIMPVVILYEAIKNL